MEATLEAKRTTASRKARMYTAEDLLNHPEWGPCELIRGKVVKVCRPNFEHGDLAAELTIRLGTFVREKKLGKIITGDSGVCLERKPDTVRGPDIYFVAVGRYPVGGARRGYLEVPPELCVEIVSPNDRWSKMTEKVDMFLSFGVKLVWVVDPLTRKVHVFRGNKTVEIVESGGELSGEQVLSGFKLSLKELFAVLD